VLCLHGEPTWSFLYRKMIPVFVRAGYRAVAPDFAGFGRSDKPASRSDYTFQSHVDWMAAWLRQLDLSRVTLVCQDWGGLIGLRLVAEHPERFARVVAANTGLPTGEGSPSEAFMAWRKLSQEMPVMPVGQFPVLVPISPDDPAAPANRRAWEVLAKHGLALPLPSPRMTPRFLPGNLRAQDDRTP